MKDLAKKILHYFDDKPHIVSITLFGSYAKNTAVDTSDVDIAILCEKSHIPNSLTLMTWKEDISTLVHKDVDLICLNTSSPMIGMQVYKNGKDLVIKNAREHANYQMLLFSEYAELKELRAPMEKNILKRKYYD